MNLYNRSVVHCSRNTLRHDTTSYNELRSGDVKSRGSHRCDWMLLAPLLYVIDAVPLFEENLCVNFLFACTCDRLGIFFNNRLK